MFDINEKEHKDKLMMILIKVADISNEARPMEISNRWANCLIAEFANQMKMERKEGIESKETVDIDKVCLLFS